MWTVVFWANIFKPTVEFWVFAWGLQCSSEGVSCSLCRAGSWHLRRGSDCQHEGVPGLRPRLWASHLQGLHQQSSRSTNFVNEFILIQSGMWSQVKPAEESYIRRVNKMYQCVLCSGCRWWNLSVSFPVSLDMAWPVSSFPPPVCVFLKWVILDSACVLIVLIAPSVCLPCEEVLCTTMWCITGVSWSTRCLTLPGSLMPLTTPSWRRSTFSTSASGGLTSWTTPLLTRWCHYLNPYFIVVLNETGYVCDW